MSTFINSEQKAGTIIKKAKHSLVISIDTECKTKSGGCSGGCGACGGGESTHRKAMIPCKDIQNYSIGDRIEILHHTLNENLVAFIVFGIPIVFAFLTILGFNLYNPAMAESPQSFISAGIAFVAGFFIVRIIDIWFRTKYPSTIISTSSRKQQKA